jgi:hypothetical protein
MTVVAVVGRDELVHGGLYGWKYTTNGFTRREEGGGGREEGHQVIPGEGVLRRWVPPFDGTLELWRFLQFRVEGGLFQHLFNLRGREGAGERGPGKEEPIRTRKRWINTGGKGGRGNRGRRKRGRETGRGDGDGREESARVRPGKRKEGVAGEERGKDEKEGREEETQIGVCLQLRLGSDGQRLTGRTWSMRWTVFSVTAYSRSLVLDAICGKRG